MSEREQDLTKLRQQWKRLDKEELTTALLLFFKKHYTLKESSPIESSKNFGENSKIQNPNKIFDGSLGF